MAILGGNERDLTVRLLANVDNFKKNINDAQKQTDTFGSKVGDGLKKVGVAVAAAAAAAGAFAVKFGVDAVKAASNLSETVSKVNVLFGQSAGSIEKFAAAAAQKFGQSKQQALDAAATFATFGKAAGLSGESLVKFSTDFTGLASDLASFNNTSPEQAINAIGAALRGEAEPLRAYGVLLNDATLKQAALELGIISTTTQALTPQQKVLAAQKVIYEQTTAAQGDFARTSDGLANQQRILAAEFENVKASIGNALLPVAVELFNLFNDKVVPIFKQLADDFNQNVQPVIEKLWAFIKENVIPIFVALWRFIWEELIPVLRDLFAPVVLGIIEILRNLETRTDKNREAFEKLGAMLDKVWFFIKTYLVPLIEFVLINKLKELEVAVNTVVTVTEFLINNIERLIKAVPGLELLLKALGFAWEKSGAAAEYQQEKNDAARKSWLESTTAINTEFKPAVKEAGTILDSLTTSTSGATNATKQLTAATKESTKALQEQFTVAQSLDLMRAGFGSAAGGVVQAGSANIKPQLPGGETFRSAAELISQFGGKIVGFNANPSDPFYGFTKGDTLDLFKKSSGTNVVVNVNGTVMDPEGVARAVSDVLVRSGGRAGNLPLGDLLGVA